MGFGYQYWAKYHGPDACLVLSCDAIFQGLVVFETWHKGDLPFQLFNLGEMGNPHPPAIAPPGHMFIATNWGCNLWLEITVVNGWGDCCLCPSKQAMAWVDKMEVRVETAITITNACKFKFHTFLLHFWLMFQTKWRAWIIRHLSFNMTRMRQRDAPLWIGPPHLHTTSWVLATWLPTGLHSCGWRLQRHAGRAAKHSMFPWPRILCQEHYHPHTIIYHVSTYIWKGVRRRSSTIGKETTEHQARMHLQVRTLPNWWLKNSPRW